VFYRGRNRLDAQVVIEGLQASVNKLSGIISDYCVRDAKSANNAPPYKILHVFGRDGCKVFGLDPFGEVVDSHEEELGMPFSWRKGTDNVHPPYGERPWGDNVVQLFQPGVMERVELLTLGTFLHVLGTVTLDGRPVVAGPQNLSSHRPRPRVISTYYFVVLDQNVLGPFAGDAFQQGGRVSSLIQVFVDHGVSGALLFHRFFFLWFACAVL